MESRNDILKREFSEAFVNKMKNAVETSYYKYGPCRKNFPELVKAAKCIQERLDAYNKTHNTEYLIDVANFAMFEFLYPMYEDSKYTPTDSDQSVGLAGAISYNQMIEEMRLY